MKLIAYSLYDEKALNFSAPFFVPAEGVALRSVADLGNDLNTTVGRHPRDYVLYEVGWFDDARGTLEPMVPRQVIRVAELLATSQARLPLEGEG
jgi:hypothetical protein